MVLSVKLLVLCARLRNEEFERSGSSLRDRPGFGDLVGDFLDTGHCWFIKRDRWEDESSIARVNPGILDMLTYGCAKNKPIACDCVHINLRRILNKFGTRYEISMVF